MKDSENVDWWDSGRRSRATLLCVICVALVFLFFILSPSGWVGLVTGLFIGGMNLYFSVHPNTRFYPGRLGTSQPRGPEQHPRWFYRVLFFAAGTIVVWDAVWQFLHHRG